MILTIRIRTLHYIRNEATKMARAVMKDGYLFNQSGQSSSLFQLERAYQEVFGYSSAMNGIPHVSHHEKILGEYRLYSLINFVTKLLRNDKSCSSQLKHLQFCIPEFANEFGFSASFLSGLSSKGTYYIEISLYWVSQRLVGKAGLYGTTKGWMHDIVGEVEQEDSDYPSTNLYQFGLPRQEHF